MASLRFRASAREDLLSIWRYLAQYDSAAADRAIDRIEGACRRLTVYPKLGRVRSDIDSEARLLVIDRWIALYRLIPSGVQVVRIVDGRRDLTKLRLGDTPSLPSS